MTDLVVGQARLHLLGEREREQLSPRITTINLVNVITNVSRYFPPPRESTHATQNESSSYTSRYEHFFIRKFEITPAVKL